jgi:hypothetical protein
MELLKEISWKFYLNNLVSPYYSKYNRQKVGNIVKKLELEKQAAIFRSSIGDNGDWISNYQLLSNIVSFCRETDQRKKAKRAIKACDGELSIAYERYKPVVQLVIKVWSLISIFTNDNQSVDLSVKRIHTVKPSIHSKESIYEWPLLEYINYVNIMLGQYSSTDESAQIGVNMTTVKELLYKHCFLRSYFQFPRLLGILFRTMLSFTLMLYDASIDEDDYNLMLNFIAIDSDMVKESASIYKKEVKHKVDDDLVYDAKIYGP